MHLLQGHTAQLRLLTGIYVLRSCSSQCSTESLEHVRYSLYVHVLASQKFIGRSEAVQKLTYSMLCSGLHDPRQCRGNSGGIASRLKQRLP